MEKEIDILRERVRERDRQTDRQTDGQKDREKNEKETELYNSLTLKRSYFGQVPFG